MTEDQKEHALNNSTPNWDRLEEILNYEQRELLGGALLDILKMGWGSLKIEADGHRITKLNINDIVLFPKGTNTIYG